MADADLSPLCKGFSKLNKEQRFERLLQMGALTLAEVKQLRHSQQLDTSLAETFVENVIGYFQMPLGVAVNFRIDNKDYIIPMAVEETSIIAAASKNAGWVRDQGEITTEMLGHLSIGQIQIANVKNFNELESIIQNNKTMLIDQLNKSVAHGLFKRGGGVSDLELRKVSRDGDQCTNYMAVLHVLVDTCDAMGANIIGQICQALKEPIETLTHEKVTMCILSNLNDRKVTRAKVVIRDIEPDLGEKIVEASLFAWHDPYRAATHNKGVLNGIDPVLIATGNDWRAVEAGIHSYACRDGQYRPITQWYLQGNDLIGIFEAPIIVGITGGVTQLHPTAKICLNMLKVKSAEELSRIIAAVGLIQNLGSIKALATFKFIEGHMNLHISNLIMSVGATANEKPTLEKKLKSILAKTNRISISQAAEALQQIREACSITEEY